LIDGEAIVSDDSGLAVFALLRSWPRNLSAVLCRDDCGYALANAGHNTRRIQDWLGYRSIQHTTRYTQLTRRRSRTSEGRGALRQRRDVYLKVPRPPPSH